jgi:hypothetical protein
VIIYLLKLQAELKESPLRILHFKAFRVFKALLELKEPLVIKAYREFRASRAFKELQVHRA